VIFNGYADQVASIVQRMDLKKFPTKVDIPNARHPRQQMDKVAVFLIC